jgi:hypothetical protein
MRFYFLGLRDSNPYTELRLKLSLSPEALRATVPKPVGLSCGRAITSFTTQRTCTLTFIPSPIATLTLIAMLMSMLAAREF